MIVVYGQNGQLGNALAKILQDNAVVFASREYDFSNLENIQQALKNIDAKVIINATAYTDVNKAETDEEAAFKANALIPEALAKYCKQEVIPFIHYSTDYVFPGVGEKPQNEDTQTSPLNAYGRTKLAGEEKIIAVGGKYLIFRTSWVYNHSHKNFFTTMLKLAAERESLSVVRDQYGAPTYAAHLAKATLEILRYCEQLNGKFPSGIYHLCNSGVTSWHGFAEAIFEEAKNAGITLKVKEVKAIPADDFPTPAKRPHNSLLDCSRVYNVFGVKMPDWQDGLKECIVLLAL